MAFVKLGRKNRSMEATTPSKNKVWFPNFHVEKDVGLSEEDAGKVIIATVKLKVRSVERRADEEGKRDTSSFDVLAMDLSKKKKDLKGMSETELDNEEEKEFNLTG